MVYVLTVNFKIKKGVSRMEDMDIPKEDLERRAGVAEQIQKERNAAWY